MRVSLSLYLPLRRIGRPMPPIPPRQPELPRPLRLYLRSRPYALLTAADEQALALRMPTGNRARRIFSTCPRRSWEGDARPAGAPSARSLRRPDAVALEYAAAGHHSRRSTRKALADAEVLDGDGITARRSSGNRQTSTWRRRNPGRLLAVAATRRPWSPWPPLHSWGREGGT